MQKVALETQEMMKENNRELYKDRDLMQNLVRNQESIDK